MCGHKIRNKAILVTGGTSGIGLSIAIYLRYLGYTVYATSRNPDKYELQSLKETFLQQNKYKVAEKILKQIDFILSEIKFIKLDLTDTQSIDECISQIQTEVGMVDVLINNAGFSNFCSIEENDPKLIRAMFDTNVIGPVYLIKKVLPKMRESRSGRIINITSMAGYQALPFMGIYAATKAAIMRLSEALQLECYQFNIKVSSVVLGTFKTSFYSSMQSMHQSKSNEDISDANLSAPTILNSPYSPLSRKVWEFIKGFFSEGSRPLMAAKKIAKVIKKEDPKISYQFSRFNEAVFNLVQKYGSTQLLVSLLNWIFKR